MDNFFELLPFIIGILYFVFGRGKKTKETSKPRKRQPQPTKNTPSLEDILKELTGESSQPTPKEVVPEVVLEPIEPEEPVYEDTIVHDADTGPSIDEIRKKLQEEKKLEVQDRVMDFDLRQAIINETVLNRPYQ
ncbi:MAG: hypothetical protein JXR19_06245 [Bacteroidia bacterium]